MNGKSRSVDSKRNPVLEPNLRGGASHSCSGLGEMLLPPIALLGLGQVARPVTGFMIWGGGISQKCFDPACKRGDCQF